MMTTFNGMCYLGIKMHKHIYTIWWGIIEKILDIDKVVGKLIVYDTI